MKPFCLYLRKSRIDIEAEARGEGETLSRHEKILLDLAKRLNLAIGDIKREIVSGETIAARPVMQELLTEVEQGLWEGVLVVEIERLARGATIDQGIVAQAFKYSNTKIITPNKTYDPSNELDEEFFEFALFMSRREYKTITRRMQSGRLQSVKEGKYVGNIPPYGYTRTKLEKQKGYTLTIHPEQSVIVKMIFDFYVTQRIGVGLIVRKLNELGIPPAKGDVWVTSSIQTILRNPVYCGKAKWNSRPQRKKIIDGQIIKERPRAKMKDWVLVNGLHESIITQNIFDLAQTYLKDNPSRPCPKDTPIKNPLAGLVICGLCGRKMVRRPYAKKELPSTLMCPSSACKNISSHLDTVESKLLLALEDWFENYKLSWSQPKEKDEKSIKINLKKKSLKQLEDELKNLDSQKNKMYDLLEQGVYSTDVFLERSKSIAERIDVKQINRNNLLAEIEQEENKKENSEVIIPRIQKVLELYRASNDPAKKNELLNEVIDRVTYTKITKSHRTHPSDSFKLILYPKYPLKD